MHACEIWWVNLITFAWGMGHGAKYTFPMHHTTSQYYSYIEANKSSKVWPAVWAIPYYFTSSIFCTFLK